MNDQQQLRGRREAFVQPVNRHDTQAVQGFVHPTFACFEAKARHGKSGDRACMVKRLERPFAPGMDYRETADIEHIAVPMRSGDPCRRLRSFPCARTT